MLSVSLQCDGCTRGMSRTIPTESIMIGINEALIKSALDQGWRYAISPINENKFFCSVCIVSPEVTKVYRVTK